VRNARGAGKCFCANAFMRIYKVKLVSQSNAIVVIFSLLISFFIEAAIFFPHGLHDTFLAILLVILEFMVAIFIWQKFVTGGSEWTVDSSHVSVKWSKKFAYSDIGDYILEWKDIVRIWQGMDPNYYNLKFKLTTGRTITFYHNDFANDDFDELLKILYQTFEEKKIKPK
jgi:hypothetical protein